MKPILFDGSAKNFNTNGLGVLSDCISCLVTEVRNGVYEVEFTYPITGIRYGAITAGRIVLVSHDERKNLQPFVIYRISKSINGVVTVNAYHISYQLNNVIVAPYSETSISLALNGLRTNALTANPFTFWTDKTNSGTFDVAVPTSARTLLGGSEGSILDTFGGGEYEFDNYTVKLYAHRGSNNGVTIRYGKNLTDITAETDHENLYNSVVPYWANGTGTIVYGGIVSGNGGVIREETWTDERNVPMQDENGDTLTFNASLRQVVTMDLSGDFEEAPTVAQLESRAQTILNSNTPWIPKENIKIDFIALWQTEEYKNIAALERVRLCDTVTVQYDELGVDVTTKVIKVVWDALTERYTEMELGEAKTSFADTIMAETNEKLKEYPSKSFLEDAVDHATQQITGGLGGNIVFTLNGDGKPIEQLIMDTEDKSTAVNVWRWNLGGLGHSHSGYNGPFDDIAITQDGRINASMITVGTLSASVIAANSISVSKLTGSISNGNWKIDLNAGTLTIGNISADNITTGTMSAARISGGTLTLGGTTGGTLSILNSSGIAVVTGNASGLTINSGSINIGSGTFKVTSAGALTATSATITGTVTATGGAIGGFDITSTSIKTKDVAITSNATNSIGLSSADFTRTINGTSRAGLRFAIGANFGVTSTGALHAANANLSGRFRNSSGSEWIGIDESVISGGYGSATHGMLDLSSKYADNSYKVVLENKVSDIIMKTPANKQVYLQHDTQRPLPLVVGGKTLGISGNDYISEICIVDNAGSSGTETYLEIGTINGGSYLVAVE